MGLSDRFFQKSEVILIACYYPMRAIRKPGSNQYKMIKMEQRRFNRSDWVPYVDKDTGELIEPIELPCGKCIGCRLEYSRQWANRCVLESLSYPKGWSWFLTLTIDDDHLGEYVTSHGFATVHTDDITTFMKALRGRWADQHEVSDGIRFFGASEYGDDSMRPHYHILVFGLPLFDLEIYKNNAQGDTLYKSKELDGVWKKGFVTVGEFNWNTAAYTARYVMKKAKGMDAGYYEALDIEPEKTRMSRRPGIGQAYLDHHIEEIYDLDEIVLPASHGTPHAIAPPKFFDKKLKDLDEPFFNKIKDQRKRIAEIRQQAKGQQHGYDPLEYLAVEERAKKNSLSVFKRSNVNKM